MIKAQWRVGRVLITKVVEFERCTWNGGPRLTTRWSFLSSLRSDVKGGPDSGPARRQQEVGNRRWPRSSCDGG
jgi:hypothetical protein